MTKAPDVQDVELEDEVYDKEKKEKRHKRRRQKKLLNYQHKIKAVEPRTANQRRLFESFENEKHVLLHGSAGTGKTYCALYLALQDLLDGKFEQIILLRSIVPTRDIGFLPGTLNEKIQVYEEPYQDIVDTLLGKKGSYGDLKRDEVLVFKSTSFLRGVSWNNSLIIADEVQNCTWHELCSLVTRVGEGSKIVLLGDREQNDLSQTRSSPISGLESAIRVCQNVSRFDVVEFGVEDILRSELVKEFLTVKQKLGL